MPDTPKKMKIRTILLLISLSLSLAVAVNAQTVKPSPAPVVTQSGYVRPSQEKRFKRYFKNMFGPEADAQNAINAGIATWRNTPREWGTHWNGFGKRFVSNVGRGVISNTTRFGLEEAFKLDSHYYLSQKRDTGSKIKSALMSPFTARNKNGKLVFGFPRIIGTYTGHIIAAETWYPKRYGWKDGLRTGTISLGTTMIFNLVKEFLHK